jgi:hypothetical protein
MTLKEISQKIIDLLKADVATLKIPVDNFFFGPPFTRNKNPFCYVAWAGGPIQPHSANTEEWDFNWHVVIVDVAKTDDDAEKSVMDKIERARVVLKGNRTLEGLVVDSQPSAMEGEVMTIGADWGKVTQIIAAARLVLNVFIRKEAT